MNFWDNFKHTLIEATPRQPIEMSDPPTLSVETRISPTTPVPSQLLRINTTSETQSPLFGAGRKRGFDEISGLDEEQYARKHLATEGSVFFRRKERAPRSFLWRVLEDRKVVEIRCVDIVHDTKSAKSESELVFRIQLPAEVIRNGIALADPEETDALEVFLLTAGNELFTITLKRDLLTRETAPSEFDVSTCVKKYASNSLAFRHPYRLVAFSAHELVVSLHDGGLLRLDRQPNESGAQWRETFFSEGTWGDTLRGLVSLKRHQTIRYGNLELEPSAVADMVKSPDGKYIWTVSLDHQLKAWDPATGRAVVVVDLLKERLDEDRKKHPKYLMGGEQGKLIQVVTLPRTTKSRAVSKAGHDVYHLIIHSPKDHQFKFYEISPTLEDAEGEFFNLEDIRSGEVLIPPIDELMKTNIWHLEEFYLRPGPQWVESQLWIRARSGSLCQTFKLTFSLVDEESEQPDLEHLFRTAWTVINPGMQTTDALRNLVDFPGEVGNVADSSASVPSEKWIEFLFHPGRFSSASIETALHVYRKGRGLLSASSKGLNAPELPLKERLMQATSSKIILRRLPNEQPDFARYQADVQAQWNTFYTLLTHLHSRRHESIGLALDFDEALAWHVCADFVGPVRTTSDFERLCLNQKLLQDDGIKQVDAGLGDQVFPNDEVVYHCQLLTTAANFSSRLSPEFREKLHKYIDAESLNHDHGDNERNAQRVQTLYDVHKFQDEVMDEDFKALEAAAELLDGLGGINDNAFLGIVEGIHSPATGKARGKSLNNFGAEFMMATAQETLQRERRTLLDLLTLIVFMYGDLDQDDLNAEFVAGIGPLYDAILVPLKHNNMLLWLAGNSIEEPEKAHRSSKTSQNLNANPSTITLLERISIGDWQDKAPLKAAVPEQLTTWSLQWLYGAPLFNEWDGVTAHVMGFLIKEQRHDLAAEFQKFLSQGEESSVWLRYLEGRVLLATGKYAQASLKFKAAADGLAETKTDIGAFDTAHLLSPEERNYFGDKNYPHSRYFEHISALFEKLRIFSYAADFAGLALAHLGHDDDLSRSIVDVDRRKEDARTPEEKAKLSGEELHILKAMERNNHLRSRLFSALKDTGRFREAFDALAGIHDAPVKKANLAELIKACVSQDAVPSLLDLPFEKGNLVQEADAILLDLAKKYLAQGSEGTRPYHQILYAFRTQRAKFRGAAEILYEYLERLRYSHRKHGMMDPEDETLIQAYVLLINTLACCGEEDAWLLADPIAEVNGSGAKRKLVTIADVRREYGAELDRRSDVLQGRFPLVGGDEMDML